jgi:hypothetical protein
LNSCAGTLSRVETRRRPNESDPPVAHEIFSENRGAIVRSNRGFVLDEPVVRVEVLDSSRRPNGFGFARLGGR